MMQHRFPNTLGILTVVIGLMAGAPLGAQECANGAYNSLKNLTTSSNSQFARPMFRIGTTALLRTDVVGQPLLFPERPLALSPALAMRRWSAEDLPFFCRIEHNLGLKTQVPIKFRLGSVEYVDWLEGKGQF